tara:strand:+ start:363 stop:581 length:219 start_codon:yes stop_codon:yes gene_type:complete
MLKSGISKSIGIKDKEIEDKQEKELPPPLAVKVISFIIVCDIGGSPPAKPQFGSTRETGLFPIPIYGLKYCP